MKTDKHIAAETRLAEDARREENWKHWGPYLSERQWGTVREDYSPDGATWESFPHDHARSRAYRWGEDGLFGITDREGRLCLALALWNGRDPILKERLFGLTGPEGNHGEDVKELYFYLDSTPTHSYLKALYKFPQAEYPKASPNDILIRVTAINRGPACHRADSLVPQHLVLGKNRRRVLAETVDPERRRRASPCGSRLPGPVPVRRRSPLARPAPFPRVLPWRHGSGNRGEPPDRLDRPGREPPPKNRRKGRVTLMGNCPVKTLRLHRPEYLMEAAVLGLPTVTGNPCRPATNRETC